jgi:hypothetical protein
LEASFWRPNETHCLNLATSNFFSLEIWRIFYKKNCPKSLCWIRQPFFFWVARWREFATKKKKKKRKEKTLNYESKQNIAQKKIKEKKTLVWN